MITKDSSRWTVDRPATNHGSQGVLITGGDVQPRRYGTGKLERHEPVRDPPAGKGNPLNGRRREQPSLLPTTHGVDERLDRPRSLSTGVLIRLVKPGKENPVEMRLIPGIVPISKPKPNYVVKGIVGDRDLSEPHPEATGSLAIKAFEQPGLVAEERVDGGGGGPDAGGELTIVAIEFGGWFMTQIVGGKLRRRSLGATRLEGQEGRHRSTRPAQPAHNPTRHPHSPGAHPGPAAPQPTSTHRRFRPFPRVTFLSAAATASNSSA
jgi:hypothetical protein